MPELCEVQVRLVRASQVRLTHDLDQRHTAAVQVDQGLVLTDVLFGVHGFARVLFEMNPHQPDAAGRLAVLQVDVPALDERLLVLRNLVPLGQVRVKVVFPRKHGVAVDAPVHGKPHPDGVIDRFSVQHGEHSGHAETNGANVRVRLGTELRAAPTKDLGLRQQLGVNFETDDRFVVHFLFLTR